MAFQQGSCSASAHLVKLFCTQLQFLLRAMKDGAKRLSVTLRRKVAINCAIWRAGDESSLPLVRLWAMSLSAGERPRPTTSRVRCWKFSHGPEPRTAGDTAAFPLRAVEEAQMSSKCDRPRQRLNPWRRVRQVLRSPMLLRIALASAPYLFRLWRILERNIGDDG